MFGNLPLQKTTSATLPGATDVVRGDPLSEVDEFLYENSDEAWG
jgi:hypothetical protein